MNGIIRSEDIRHKEMLYGKWKYFVKEESDSKKKKMFRERKKRLVEEHSKYNDIINLPHYEPRRHTRMDIENRAAQFAPFAALTGYGDAVKETGRLTEDKRELVEGVKEQLDEKLRMFFENSEKYPRVTITYFVVDERKTGGKYVKVTGRIKKIDSFERSLVLGDAESAMESDGNGRSENGKTRIEEINISMEDILEIESEI